MVVISAGIRPRDELARACGLEIGPRGGVVVDDALRTLRPGHLRHRRGRRAPGHGLRPGRARLRDGRGRRGEPRGATRTFSGFDMSTKLKLMGVDVASFGDPFARGQRREGADVRRPVRGRLQEARLRPRGDPPTGRHSGRRRFRLRQPSRPVQEREAAHGTARRPACCRRGIARGLQRRPRRPDLLVQQRQRASDPRGRPRPDAHDRRAGQDLHPGRHRLRWLSTARQRSAQGGTPGNRAAQVDNRLCEHFPLQPAGALSDRDDQGDPDV